MTNSEARQFTALLEAVRSDVALVAEGLAMLNQKVDNGLREVRQEMATGFAGVHTAIAHLSGKLDSHTHGQ